jgi:type VI protein secretion system component VasA
MQVYAVRSVSVLREDLTSREALPYSDFSLPSAATEDAPPILFSADRLPSTVGPDPIVSLTLETGADLTSFVNAEVELIVTDGASPEGVTLGDLQESVSGSPSGVAFQNVAPVTRAAAPAFDADRLWRWLQFLKASLPQLTTAPHLAACVALANHPAWAEWPDAKPGAQLFESILAVRLAPASGRDDTVVPIVLDVDPAVFTGTGDLDLFGECMAAVFASTVRPYESIALTVRDDGEQTLFRYVPVPGTKEGL